MIKGISFIAAAGRILAVVTSLLVGVAEDGKIIVDFSKFLDERKGVRNESCN